MAVDKAKYREPRWLSKRQQIYEKYRGICQHNKCGRITPSHEGIVHHIIEATEENFYDDTNLIYWCKSCHTTHHNRMQQRKKPEFLDGDTIDYETRDRNVFVIDLSNLE